MADLGVADRRPRLLSSLWSLFSAVTAIIGLIGLMQDAAPFFRDFANYAMKAPIIEIYTATRKAVASAFAAAGYIVDVYFACAAVAVSLVLHGIFFKVSFFPKEGEDTLEQLKGVSQAFVIPGYLVALWCLSVISCMLWLFRRNFPIVRTAHFGVAPIVWPINVVLFSLLLGYAIRPILSLLGTP